MAAKRQRIHYEEWQKQRVREKYPKLKNKQEKIDLAREIGIANPERNLHKLYNLASRERTTRTYTDPLHTDDYPPPGVSVEEIKRIVKQEEIEDLKARAKHENVKFTRKDDEYIRNHFGSMKIADIAKQRDHTESAIMYRARHLRAEDGVSPLRRPCVGYFAYKVAAWLNLEEADVLNFSKLGVEVRPLPDEAGVVENYWVHTQSLSLWVLKHEKELLKKGADYFFVQDVIESAKDLSSGKTISEDCYFLEHGHICVNKLADASCGLFCDGNDRKCRVKNERP